MGKLLWALGIIAVGALAAGLLLFRRRAVAAPQEPAREPIRVSEPFIGLEPITQPPKEPQPITIQPVFESPTMIEPVKRTEPEPIVAEPLPQEPIADTPIPEEPVSEPLPQISGFETTTERIITKNFMM